MRIDQLRDGSKKFIRHGQWSIIVVLDSSGAIFNHYDTNDLKNMSPAFSALFDDCWDVIDEDEVPPDWPGESLMTWQWNIPTELSTREKFQKLGLSVINNDAFQRSTETDATGSL